MSGSRSITSIDASEYELIEATMSESARGRWFLQEYARRNRTADTEMLLGAIERLEEVIAAGHHAAPELDRFDRLRIDVTDMANAIARTKIEIAAIDAADADHGRLGVALDAIVHTTERATSEILEAAEHVQEAAWTLRESGSDGATCDELDRMATQIYTACSFQDLTAQRTARIIHTLRYIEERLGVMMGVLGDDGGPMPMTAEAAVPAEELSQGDVDRFIGMDGLSGAASTRKPELPDAEMPDDDLVFLESPPENAYAEVEATDEAPTDLALPESEEMVPDEWADAPATPSTKSAAGSWVDPVEPPKEIDIEAAFAEIDDMTPEEKMALFS